MLPELENAVESLERARQAKLAELRAIEDALASLAPHTQAKSSELAKSSEYEGLGIVEAAKRWLKEIGGEARTEDIAKAILARGVTTKSKRFVPTVYATLANSKEFVRHGDKWALKQGQ
jgi:hypothetical protein